MSDSLKGLQLKVSDNGRHFVDQNGKPFFYLGDTCWLLFQRLDREETEEYLTDRARKGFTVIQAYVLRGVSKTNRAGATALTDGDPARPNEAFFRHVDWVVGRANELGLVMALVVAKSWHVNGIMKPQAIVEAQSVPGRPEKVFDTANARVFGRFLGARYRDSAVLWYVGGDFAPGAEEAVWVAMAQGLKEGGDGRHLVSYHGSGGTSSSQWFHQADWLDFNSIQSGHGRDTKTYEFIARDRALAPPKPTLDMEPSYENHATKTPGLRIDARQQRQGAYWAMLAGAAGHGYGAMDLFYLYKDGDGPFPHDGYMPWRVALQYDGARQVGAMRRLFEQLPWTRLVPDQSVIASGQEDGVNHIQAARTADGSLLLAYLPEGRPAGIRMDALAGGPVRARWHDPRQGAWRDAGLWANTGVREFMAPTQGPDADWLLVLDRPA